LVEIGVHRVAPLCKVYTGNHRRVAGLTNRLDQW